MLYLFPTTEEAEFAANVIAENMLSICDAEGNQFFMMKHTIDQRKEKSAVAKEDSYVWIRGDDDQRMETLR
jgi:hypothetical protein